MKTCLITLAGVLLAATNTSDARPIRTWTYDDLLKESDLVVIGSPVETRIVANTDDSIETGKVLTSEGAAVLEQILGRKADPEALLCQQAETTFDVRAVLKGKFDNKRLTLVHFRWKSTDDVARSVMSPDFPPQLIEFPREERETEKGKATNRHTCLLFLKLRKDGKCEPISGQNDAAISVRWFVPPNPSSHDID